MTAHALSVPGVRSRSAGAELLAKVLAEAATGSGSALVVHGEAGIGKTALLLRSFEAAPGPHSLRTTGTEFEMELPYAALQQLCQPVLDRRHSLPEPQREALESAFGLHGDRAPDLFLVGLAVLGLLHEVSRDEPVLCVVDDAQWIDQASLQALAFVARRVEDERIAVVFAVRDPDAVGPLASLRRLPVPRLDDADARALLATAVRAPLDDDVRDRIVAEAHGNPLALLELPRSAGAHGLAGGFVVPGDGTVPHAVQEEFAQRIADLPVGVRTLLVLAAAEPLGDPQLLRRAAGVLGLDPGALRQLETAGLLVLGVRIRFRHPLVRNVAYCGAGAEERRRAHDALAEVTDPEADPDRRAWHRAEATLDPDEAVAVELERSAGRALARGGLAAAATFLARAADLTPDASRRATRRLTAAETTFQAGAADAARELLEHTDVERLPPGERGRARVARAFVDVQTHLGSQVVAELLDAADHLEPDLARETYLTALTLHMYLDRAPGRLPSFSREIAQRAPARTPSRPVDLLLDALLAKSTLSAPAAVPVMQRAVAAFRDDRTDFARWAELACQQAFDLHDDAALLELGDRHVDGARRRGELAVLPRALNVQAVARVSAGRFTDAAESLAEAQAIEAATRSSDLAFGGLILAAWRGDEARVQAAVETARAGGHQPDLSTEIYARTVLANGLGRFEAALETAQRGAGLEAQGSYVGWHLASELVEAAARSGRPEEGHGALERTAERARASGTAWALGVELGARALLADDDTADALHAAAVEHLSRSQAKASLARAQLVHGEWLRRRGRRVEARAQLRAAHEALVSMGANGFAARAARELVATGERVRRPGTGVLDDLTAQELLIARQVAGGASSKEVAAALFLSPRTIDAHLRNIYRKLDISSRRQLRGLGL